VRGRHVDVDVHVRQTIALCALASSLMSTGVCLGFAVAHWSLWLVLVAAVPALAGSVIAVAAFPPAEPVERVLYPLPPEPPTFDLDKNAWRPGLFRPTVPPVTSTYEEI
jgi:hypothetical protein